MFHYPKIFRPMIERIKVVMKKIRQKVAGSLKKRMPTITAPTAPIPVHTGYTVPIGNRSAAFAIRNILSERAAKNPTHHHIRSWPEADFVLPRQNVKATSMHPAKIRINQLSIIICCLFEGYKNSRRLLLRLCKDNKNL